MKKTVLSLFTLMLLMLSGSAYAQKASEAETMFKKHINKMVENVEKAESEDQKREILNNSFDDLIGAIEKVESMNRISDSEKEGLVVFKEDIQAKKNELNGLNGFSKVPADKLNKYANFVQQDLEQADQITIGVTTLLLIIIILLLL